MVPKPESQVEAAPRIRVGEDADCFVSTVGQDPFRTEWHDPALVAAARVFVRISAVSHRSHFGRAARSYSVNHVILRVA